jgi:hypothetical protein
MLNEKQKNLIKKNVNEEKSLEDPTKNTYKKIKMIKNI